MLKKILIAVVVLIIAFVVIVLLQPSDFRYERYTLVSAPPAVVFAQVNDFHKWENWSPWVKLDPNAKNTFSGPAEGKGAVFGWAGNNNIGEGKMTILESRPPELIKIQLDFIKPFAGTNTAEFTFKPEGNQTKVTWSMYGKSQGFICKAMGLIMNCEKMMNEYFDKGLAQIKAIAESQAKN